MGRLVQFPTTVERDIWVTKTQLAIYLQVTERTIERWVRDQGLPCHKTGPSRQHGVRFVLADAEAWYRDRAASVGKPAAST